MAEKIYASVPLEDIPLLKSAWLHRIKLARMLLEGGAPVDQTNSVGHTALAIACISNHVDEQTTSKPKFISYLLTKGASPNTQDKYGRTPIIHLLRYHASAQYFRICMRLLLESGADILIKDQENKNALNYASDTGNMRIVMALANSLKANGNRVVVILMENKECKHCMGPCIHQRSETQALSRVSSRMTLTCVTPEEVMAEIPPDPEENEKVLDMEKEMSLSEPDMTEDGGSKRGHATLLRHQSLQLIDHLERVKGDMERAGSDGDLERTEGNPVYKCGSKSSHRKLPTIGSLDYTKLESTDSDSVSDFIEDLNVPTSLRDQRADTGGILPGITGKHES